MNRRSLVAAITALPAVGHLSVAAIYITMGLLTGLLGLGVWHQGPDVRGTIYAIKQQPLGPLVLFSLMVCACALAVWRGLQAVADLEEKGKKFTGLVQRARLIGSSMIYLGLCGLIGRILLNQPTPSGEAVARASASQVIFRPMGWLLLFVAGLVCIGVGGGYLYRALTGNFESWFRRGEMTPRQRRVCFLLGRLGYGSRAVILGTVGYLVASAAFRVRPDEVTGQAGAIHTILRQPWGPGVVGLLAIGFMANGLFALATARFGKIPEKKIEEVVRKPSGKARAGAC